MDSFEYKTEVNESVRGFGGWAPSGTGAVIGYAIFFGMRLISAAIVRAAYIKNSK